MGQGHRHTLMALFNSTPYSWRFSVLRLNLKGFKVLTIVISKIESNSASSAQVTRMAPKHS